MAGTANPGALAGATGGVKASAGADAITIQDRASQGQRGGTFTADGWRARIDRRGGWRLECARPGKGGRMRWTIVATGTDRAALAAAWRRLTGQGLPEGVTK